MGQNKGDGAGGRASGSRCIALVGPFASGKTTLMEAIMARTGAVDRPGSVDQGTSVGDGSPEARAHSMSVEANFASTEFMGDNYTFIDCPGSVEFTFEAQSILAAADIAVVVCEPDEKKVPALQIILKTLEDNGVPHFLFLNKIDKATARVRETLTFLQTASSAPLVLRQIPIWQNGIATGFIDLALERAHIYREHAESEVVPIPDDEQAREVEARFSMLETLADYDDSLMEQLLEEIEPPADQVFDDLVAETRAGQICPVFIGSALNGNGILRLLKALRHEAPGIEETRERLGLADQSESALQVMKTLHTTHGGKMSLSRVLTGSVSEGDVLFDAHGNSDRVSSLFQVFGQQAKKAGTASAGDTVALGKVEVAATGMTLSEDKNGMEALFVPAVPEPVLALSVRPVERKDEVKLSASLARIVEEDPSLSLTHSQDTGETLFGGQGDMHLRVALERLTGKYGIVVESSVPRVPYKETIRGKTTKRGRHKKQSGGHGQFGDVVLDIRPLGRGEGFAFDDTITGGVVPKQYIPSVKTGVGEYLSNGPLGFPVVDVGVTLTDGSYHTVDSSDQAFKTAAQIAMREGMAECRPVLLEPVSRVTVVCPSEDTAKINAILSGRRGQIMGFDSRQGWNGWDEVQAMMPAAELQNLIVEIRSATAGVGTYTAEFDHLAELTGRLADDVLQQHASEAA
ncbi:MAG: elongation factor G [Pseudomonadota bacterium]